MLVTGPLETLMVVAPKKCFWPLPQVFLAQLGVLRGVVMPEKTLGAMLLALLTKELPGLEELALVKILHQRMELDFPDLDLIKQGVAQECFSDYEQKEVEDFATKHHKTKEASLTVQADMAKLHKAIAQNKYCNKEASCNFQEGQDKPWAHTEGPYWRRPWLGRGDALLATWGQDPEGLPQQPVEGPLRRPLHQPEWGCQDLC